MQSSTQTSRWGPRVTVAALIERQGRYLMVEEQTSAGLQLNTPAGHLEPGESLHDAAVREALEETACHFTPEAVLGVYLAASPNSRGQDNTWLRVAFCGQASEPVPGLTLDTGIVRTLWLSAQEIEQSRARHRSPLVWLCVQDHMRGQRYPLDLLHTDPTALLVTGR